MLVFAFVLLCTLLIFLILERYHQPSNRLLNGMLAFVSGNALLSFAYSAVLFTNVPYVVVLGAGCIFFAAAIFYFRQSFTAFSKRSGEAPMPAISMGLFLICLYLFSSDFLKLSKFWGEWDAYAIWSLHAKFLTNSETFEQLFVPALEWSHPDYPLMLPSWIAAYWKALGSNHAGVPLFIAYFTSIAVLLVPFLHFYPKKAVFGLICVLLLCSENVLLPFGAYQYADTVLALFMLLSFVIWEQLSGKRNSILLFLMGFIVACCGWIKNEGLAFFGVYSLFLFFHFFREKVWFGYYLLGAILPLSFICFFKLNYATPSDLFVNGYQDMLDKLRDTTRYHFVWDYVWDYLSEQARLLLYLLLFTLLFRPRYFLSFQFLIMLGLFCVYLMIYIITPNDLEWHLATSFNRLLHQLMPAVIFSVLSSFSKKYLVEMRAASV